jgi:hypothetical protein
MTNKVLKMESNSDELLTTTKITLTTPNGTKIAFYSSNVINEIIANIKQYETDCAASSDDANCKTCNKITFNSIYRIIVKCLQGESDKGVLEKLSEDQDTLLKTCSEWDKAIEKRGYVE